MYACVNVMQVWIMHDISKEEPKTKLVCFFIFRHFYVFCCHRSNAFSAIIEFIEWEKFVFVLIWIFSTIFGKP